MDTPQLAGGRSLLVSTQLCGLQAGGFTKPSRAVCCCLGCSEDLLWVVGAGGNIGEVLRKKQLRKQCGGSSEGVSASSVKKSRCLLEGSGLIQIGARRQTRKPKQEVTGFCVLGWASVWDGQIRDRQMMAQVGRKSQELVRAVSTSSSLVCPSCLLVLGSNIWM